MKRAIVFFLCCFTMVAAGEIYSNQTTLTTGLWQGQQGQTDPFEMSSHSDALCELCGLKLAINLPNRWDDVILCDNFGSHFTDWESAQCTDSWQCSFTHDLCRDCQSLAESRMRPKLTELHGKLWKELVEQKAGEKLQRSKQRQANYRSHLERQIAELQKELQDVTSGLAIPRADNK